MNNKFSYPYEVNPSVEAMTLRDHFAACALPALIINNEKIGCCNFDEDIAEACYRIADSMIAERRKGQT